MLEFKDNTVCWTVNCVRLSRAEAAAFEVLWTRRTRRVPATDLALAIWGDKDGPQDERNNIHSIVSMIRTKLRKLPIVIYNYRGSYCLMLDDAVSESGEMRDGK